MAGDDLVVDQLSVIFRSRTGTHAAVRDASFRVGAGRMVGLVGESGSGKTATGLALLGLHDPATTTIGGGARFGDTDLLNLSPAAADRLRGSLVGMIFQDPMTALNPLLTIGTQVTETIRVHEGLGRRAARDKAIDVLARVGMPDPAGRYRRYPHELSGGLRQRAMIAAAIACRPRLLVADEPTTALDLTIQAQILRLLRTLCDDEGMSVLLITHDLGAVGAVCDDVVTMYAGEVVEIGPTAGVLDRPRHPYTSRLMAARPRVDGWGEQLDVIPGRVPPPSASPEGCLFRPRCREAREECAGTQELVALGPGRSVRCIRASDPRDSVVVAGAGVR
ncbi:ABC transporter ATP-binding protein [Pseudonocardia sp. NPDC049154]|uniref:ABC transporter ATP-binding protein n=1 Tax=Pseudonocardia sp. NPDC049154 TaxID=3155501 RepID=UPI003403E27E